MTIDRLTKLLVLVSMTAAVVLEAALMRGGWAPVLPVTIAVLLSTCVLSVRFPAVAMAAVLLFSYTFPAVIVILNGQFEIGYMTVWVSALLGVMLPSSWRRGWALPPAWRMPLVLWALTVSILWPIVALREIDFSWAILNIPRLSVTGPPGVPPLLSIVWTLNVALVLGVGILWFDWLHATFDGAEPRFRASVIGALAASWGITTSVAVYQMLVDVTFMNSGRYGFLQRASGLMFDANPFGVVAALGLPVVAAAAFLTSWRGRTATLVVVVLLAWAGLWASGSRTALAAGVIMTVFVAYYWWDRAARSLVRPRQLMIPVVIVLAALVLVPFVLQQVSDVGPWRRLVESLPGLTMAELWNRDGYGLNAAQMIREFPVFGVGVGSFHHLVLDYSRLPGNGGSIPIDNAQNWYRHQLAEFGLAGSLGWILWTISFGWFLVTTSGSGAGRGAAGSIKGALVALALISMLGMPTQNVAVTLTFWTLAFWYAQLAREPFPLPGIAGSFEQGREPASLRTPSSRWAWLTVGILVTICAVGTVYSARHDLRVPERAARFGWPYSYGWYAPEPGGDGEFRWAGRHAVAVLDAPRPWLKLTVSVNHVDIARRPVEIKVWMDSNEVLATRLSSSTPVSDYVRVPDGHPRIVLETWVDRVVRPADFGVPDPRELGLMVQWDFVDAPPSLATPSKE